MSLQVIQHLVKAGTISSAQADICQTQSRHLLAKGERVQPSDLVARNRFAHPRKVAEAFTAVHGTTTLSAAELLPAGLSARLGVVPVNNVAGVLTVKAGHRLTSGQRTAILQAATPAAHELRVIAIDSLSLRAELGALNSDVRSLASSQLLS